MNDRQKAFQQKINNRKFAIDNSWRGSTNIQDEIVTPGQTGTEDQMRQVLNALGENLQEADLCKVNNGEVPIFLSRSGLLGRLVFFAKRVVRKLINVFLKWYVTPLYRRQNYFNGKIVNAVSLERDLILKLETRIAELEKANKELRSAFSERNEHEDELNQRNQIDIYCATTTVTNLSTQFAAEMQNIGVTFDNVESRLNKLVNGVETQSTKLTQLTTSLENETKERSAKLKQLHSLVTAEILERTTQLDQINAKLDNDNASIYDLRNKLAKIENLPTLDDEFYHHFEECFRGSREEIKNRLQAYVPIIREYLPDWSHARFVDIGSGRGEWLDILRENGATDYIGVDLNAKQNAVAESFGHNTTCCDCIEYLTEQPDNSVDLITGIQIIEHLCMSDLMELLKQAHRVLKKGGLILFETPNPRNVIVGSDTFYIDPSHKRFLDPRMTEFFAKWAKFDTVRIIDANANPQWVGLPLPAENADCYELIKQFNDLKWLMYGPMDYALFAVKE